MSAPQAAPASPPAPRVEMVILDRRLKDDPDLWPKRSTSGSAAYDLRACISDPVEIRPGEVVEMGFGIAVHIADPGYCALVVPRSGLGTRDGIVLANIVGLIDSDYTGEIRAGVWNRGSKPFTVEPYQRLFQLALLPVARHELDVVESFSSESERGSGGFGSTGTD